MRKKVYILYLDAIIIIDIYRVTKVMKKLKKVLLLIGKSREFDRNLLRGIARYMRLYPSWMTLGRPHHYLSNTLQDKFVSDILAWKPDGIIASHDELIQQISKLAVPQVIIGDIQHTGIFQTVISSNTDMISRMAADHLLSCGLKSFAYYGYNDLPFSIKRQTTFCQYLATKGIKVYVYENHRIKSKDKEQTIRWLKFLPKPTGLMCCNDDQGQELIQICHLIQIKIPDEITVIGVDNDQLVCEFTIPPLSSIVLNSEKVGYEVGELLDNMMAGQNIVHKPIIIEPISIKVRHSTDFIAVDDPIVSKALRYIQENNQRVLSVSNVADHLSVSRRVLQQRFKQGLGRTIFSELRRTRIEKMAQFILETDLTIMQIAQKMGFPGFEHVSRCFKKQMGLSPTDYREKYRI